MGGRDGDMETNEKEIRPQDREQKSEWEGVSRLTKQTVYNWHPEAPVNDRGVGSQ